MQYPHIFGVNDMRKRWLGRCIVLLGLFSGYVHAGETYLYADLEHISSVQDGPFPSWRPENKETEVNAMGVGIHSDFDSGAFLDFKLAWQVGGRKRSELEGADPFAFIRFGWRIKTWQH